MIAIVEMPMGTKFKYEIDKNTGRLILDRPISVAIPHNYGFIPNTLADDGDPIDVFIASLEPIPPLTQVTVSFVGIIKGIDKGKQDDKLLAYIVGDEEGRRLVNKSEFLAECLWYLKSYKPDFIIKEVLGPQEAVAQLMEVRVK